MKAWQLRINDNDETSIVWADSAGKAKAQFNTDGIGLSGWYVHDLNYDGIYNFTDVNAIRRPKLDDMEHENPIKIIRILVKNYNWESDEININTVDNILKNM